MNSSHKIYSFFIGILVLSVFFVLRPPENTEAGDRDFEEVATLEVSNFILLSVASNQLEFKVAGKTGLQFEDREEFWDFSLVNYNPNLGGLKALKTQNNTETLYAHHGVQRQDLYLFDGEVLYTNADGMTFQASNAKYHIKERIFEVKGNFELKSSEGIFKGVDLFYNANSQRMNADRVKGIMWLEN